MRVTTGRVVDGRIEVDGERLIEGQRVKLVILEDEPVRVSERERRWLLDAIASADRGETVDAFALLQELESFV